jgi:hypothetical protein
MNFREDGRIIGSTRCPTFLSLTNTCSKLSLNFYQGRSSSVGCYEVTETLEQICRSAFPSIARLCTPMWQDRTIQPETFDPTSRVIVRRLLLDFCEYTTEENLRDVFPVVSLNHAQRGNSTSYKAFDHIFSPSQLSELLKQEPLTEITLYTVFSSAHHSDLSYEAAKEHLMQSAVDMYRQLWPVFKHKFWTQTGHRVPSAPAGFFQMEILEILSPGPESAALFSLAKFVTVADDQNSFLVVRTEIEEDGTVSSLPSSRHTVG